MESTPTRPSRFNHNPNSPGELQQWSAQAIARGGSLVSGLTTETLSAPTVLNCYSDKAFVAEASHVLVEKIRETVLVEGPDGVAGWSGKYAIVGLSGGGTPEPVYRAVAAYMRGEGAKELDWTKVIFFMVDERYVPEDHPDSNVKMVKAALLPDDSPVPAKNFLYPNCSIPLENCIQQYEKRLADIFAFSRPTIIVLGVGPDGHLASWFPPLTPEESFNAYDPFHLVCHTEQDRFAVKDRITISMHLILSARNKIFFLKGKDKGDVYRRLTSRPPTREEIRAEPLLQVLRSKAVTIVTTPPLESDPITEMHSRWRENQEHLSVIILGASGDLAMKKTFPALFSLYCAQHLPYDFHIAAYARSSLTLESLFEKLKPKLLAISAQFSLQASFEEDKQIQEFRAHVSVHKCDSYHCASDAGKLNKYLEEVVEKDFKHSNRMIYLALPPNIFGEAVAVTRQQCWSTTGWNRVVVEKPFGRDSESSKELSTGLAKQVNESEVFRIDHYLGKEMVLNLLVLRFANVFIEPLWSRHIVSCVRITWKEPTGTEGRGGYFDNYGIIRDVIQNHLLQILSLVAMERPVSLEDEDVRDEKVKVLRAIKPAVLSNTVIGQYTAGETMGAYLDDPGVPKNSLTPTFATTVLHIDNERWSGVPFIIKAGKALEKQITEVRIQMRTVCANLFGDPLPNNEFVIRIQPSDAIYLKCVGKQPGLAHRLVETELDLSVLERLQVGRVNDAYERLLLDVVKGDKRNFVRTDELREAWRIFTPLLREIERNHISPHLYQAGGKGPDAAYELIRKFGYIMNEGYVWKKG